MEFIGVITLFASAGGKVHAQKKGTFSKFELLPETSCRGEQPSTPNHSFILLVLFLHPTVPG